VMEIVGKGKGATSDSRNKTCDKFARNWQAVTCATACNASIATVFRDASSELVCIIESVFPLFLGVSQSLAANAVPGVAADSVRLHKN